MKNTLVLALESKALAMQHKVDELQAVHSAAALQHSILVGLCDTLSMLKDMQQPGKSSHNDEDDDNSCRPILASLVDSSSECPLLAQLRTLQVCPLLDGVLPDYCAYVNSPLEAS